MVLGIIFLYIPAKSFDYDLRYTTGVFTGTPFWNYENFTGEDSIKINDNFLRFYNALRFESELFDNFNIKVNGLRSDNLKSDNSASKTKLYEVYLNYEYKGLNIKAGRFSEFNKWTMGSIDGVAIEYNIFDDLSINAYGGLDVLYGKVFDDRDRHMIAYGDINYRQNSYGGKLKYYHNEEKDLMGVDIFSKISNFSITGNLGYDLTESQIHDGGIAVSGYLSKSIRMFANYTMLKPWMWNGYFNPDEYQRVQLGITYSLPIWGLSLSAIQMFTMIEDLNTTLSYISLNHKFINVGLNYLKAESNYKRFGISFGGNYSPIHNLRFSIGISSIDYLMNEQYFQDKTSLTSLASYLKITYNLFDDFSLSIYANYFDTENEYPKNIRGGATIQYHLRGGK